MDAPDVIETDRPANDIQANIAHTASLFVTFYYDGDEHVTNALVELFCTRLGLKNALEHDNYYYNLTEEQERQECDCRVDEKAWRYYLEPVVVYGCNILQLELCAPVSMHVHAAWKELFHKIDVQEVFNCIQEHEGKCPGYTLVYYALLHPEWKPPQNNGLKRMRIASALEALLAQQNWAFPNPRREKDKDKGNRFPLATSRVSDGNLWLFDFPRGTGVESAAIYVALEEESGDQILLDRAIQVPDGSLVLSDLFAHRGYACLYAFRKEQREEQSAMDTKVQNLRLHVTDVLQQPATSLTPGHIEALKAASQELIDIMNNIDDFQFEIKKIAYNYQHRNAFLSFEADGIRDFHARYIDMAKNEMSLLASVGLSTLERARSVVTMAQFERDALSGKHLQYILIVLCVVLGALLVALVWFGVRLG